jgi:C_GCAxxG_C_C family probable redox protein
MVNQHNNMNSVDYFLSGFNCSQSVFAPFAKKHFPDLTDALKIMSPFGGGVSHTDSLCGAVSGGIAAIGLKTGHSSADDNQTKQFCKEITKRFLAEFYEKHGSLNCTELIGYNLSEPNERDKANEVNVFRTICPKLVESAEMIITGLLEEIQGDSQKTV